MRIVIILGSVEAERRRMSFPRRCIDADDLRISDHGEVKSGDQNCVSRLSRLSRPSRLSRCVVESRDRSENRIAVLP